MDDLEASQEKVLVAAGFLFLVYWVFLNKENLIQS